MLWEPKLTSRCVRNGVIGAPRCHPLSSEVGGGRAQCVASRGLNVYGHVYVCQDVKKVGSIALKLMG